MTSYELRKTLEELFGKEHALEHAAKRQGRKSRDVERVRCCGLYGDLRLAAAVPWVGVCALAVLGVVPELVGGSE